MAKKATFDTLDHVMLKGQVTGVTRLSKKFKMLFLLGWLALLGFLIFAIFTIDSGDESAAKPKPALEEEKSKAKDEPATGAAITHGVSNGNAALARSEPVKNGPTIDLSAALSHSSTSPSSTSLPSTSSSPVKPSSTAVAPSVIVPALDASLTPAQPPSPEQLAKCHAIELRAQQREQQREQALKSGSEVNGSGWESSSAKAVAATPGSGLFSALAGSGASQPLTLNPLENPSLGNLASSHLALEDDQNKQARKEAFLRDAQTKAMPYYLPATRQAALSKYELKMGWKIPAFLIDGINADLPGKVCAQVRENVYDSATGKYLLIPQGAKVCGTYDSQVALGQTRILMVWDRLIFDDGSSLVLAGMPGTDQAGHAGFEAEVDNHYFRVLTSALLMSVVSAGMQISQPQQGNSNGPATPAQTAAAALGQQLGQVSSGMIQRNLKIQPSLSQQPGYRFNIQVTRDIIFPGPYRVATQP